jgi:hypothetical protein
MSAKSCLEIGLEVSLARFLHRIDTAQKKILHRNAVAMRL